MSREEFKVLMENCSPADAEMCAAFNEFDKDHSGFITKDELKEAMKLMGEKLSDSEIKKMIDAADTDKDGKVGLEGNDKTLSWLCSGSWLTAPLRKHLFYLQKRRDGGEAC